MSATREPSFNWRLQKANGATLISTEDMRGRTAWASRIADQRCRDSRDGYSFRLYKVGEPEPILRLEAANAMRPIRINQHVWD